MIPQFRGNPGDKIGERTGGPMTRTRIALLAALFVAAGYLAYQRYQQMAEAQADEAAR